MDTNLGRIGIDYKGAWNATDSYSALDYVIWDVADGGDGCGYIALQDNINVRPDSTAEPAVWGKATGRGQSIYDYCVEYGLFEGTEEEFAQTYTDAVNAANQAAASATNVEETVERAEALRVTAEENRVSAENDRVNAESARVNAESARVSAEGARVVAEQGRVDAEALRVTAEQDRVDAEAQRVSAESERANAELGRAQRFGELEDDVETAIGQADAAAGRADAAASHGPKIENGTWWVWDSTQSAFVDTGVEATGPQGATGADGTTPHIDATTGNWFIGTTDTGVHAQGEPGSDADVTAENIELALGYVPANEADLESKANVDGYYEQMTVGSAQKLEGTEATVETFTFAEVKGADGIAKINEVRGNSLVWNQLAKRDDGTITVAGVTYTVSGGIISLSGTSSSVYFLAIPHSDIVVGHKYFLAGCPTGGSLNTYNIRYSTAGNGETGGGVIVTASSVMLNTLSIHIASGVVTDGLVFKPMLIDLTLMGIADQISTVADFQKWFNRTYYAQNAGGILNNKTISIVQRGRNQWDEEWVVGGYSPSTGTPSGFTNRIRSKNYISVIPSTEYYFKSSNGLFVFQYDAERNFISYVNVDNTTLTTASNCRYIRFSTTGSPTITTYDNDICINISDTSFNGTYEAYKTNTITLNIPTITGKLNGEGDSVTIFEDGMRSAGTAYDYFKIDSDGYARKAYSAMQEVNLAELEWTKNGTRFNTTSSLPGAITGTWAGGVINSKYAFLGLIPNTSDVFNGIAMSGGRIYVSDDAESVADFVAKITGTTTYYQLATPLEYTLDEPIPMTFEAYAGGTLQQLPENGSEPTTSPCVISYTTAIDIVKAYNDMPEDYIPATDFDTYNTKLISALANVGITMTYSRSFNSTTGKQEFTITMTQS